ncbi:hypothetical protein [Bradyrhizobium australiense]|nr:hypothetical protein [Bradyrhizobium australiense]
MSPFSLNMSRRRTGYPENCCWLAAAALSWPGRQLRINDKFAP